MRRHSCPGVKLHRHQQECTTGGGRSGPDSKNESAKQRAEGTVQTFSEEDGYGFIVTADVRDDNSHGTAYTQESSYTSPMPTSRRWRRVTASDSTSSRTRRDSRQRTRHASNAVPVVATTGRDGGSANGHVDWALATTSTIRGTDVQQGRPSRRSNSSTTNGNSGSLPERARGIRRG